VNLEALLKKRDDLQYKRALANAFLQLGVCLQSIGQPAASRGARLSEAVQALQRSSALWKDLVTLEPQNVRYRRLAIECLVEVARLKLEADDPKSALAATDDAIALSGPFKSELPSGRREKMALQRAHWRRAEALTALGRFDEALAAWDAVLALEGDKETGPGDKETSIFNLYRWATLACTPRYPEAVQKASDYSKKNPRNGKGHYEVARIHALAARTIKGNPTDDKSAAGQNAAIAVKELRESRNLMANSDAQVRSALASDRDWEVLVTNKDWDSLRQREDFKSLLNEILAKRSP
jgi:tetratricopeptide (TPR) repeat protein